MPKGYKHLTLKQRCQIFELKAIGLLQFQIAKKIGISPSTISREFKRNSGESGYEIWQSRYRSEQRRKNASSSPRKITSKIMGRIDKHLQEQWSPEQISGRLKLENILVSHEWIYQYIWKNKSLGGTLYKHLRHSGKKYKKRSGKAGRSCIPNRVDIKDRPSIVEDKSRIGDWEGDTIIGKNHKGALLSYVDRKSKMTILEKLLNKKAAPVTEKTIERFKKIQDKCLTITFAMSKATKIVFSMLLIL